MTQNLPDDILLPRPQRYSNSDFASALTRTVRNHPVQSDGSQNQRNESEAAHKDSSEAFEDG